MSTLLWILVATLAASFLCSILEAVFLSITHSYIAVLKSDGEYVGEWLEAAQKNVEEPIAAILTLNTIAHTMGATMGGAVAAEVFQSWPIGIFSAGLTLAVLVFSEIVPKTIGATYWKQLAKPTAHILRIMIVLMKPGLWALSLLTRLITPRTERPTISRAELEVLASIGRREGTLDEDEWQVVSNVIRLDEVSIGEVMTPRTDMVAIPIDATIEGAQKAMLETGHLRLPVYRESLDTIIGILLARDVWKAERDGLVAIDSVMRPVPFSPESKAVEDLISEMREQRTKMVIVVDEFGGTAGLVTLEDLIEEIIGEIQDEHEGDEPVEFRTLLEGGLEVWGGTTLREASERLEFTPTQEEEEGYDTVGGFVLGRLNRIPVVGDEVCLESGSLRVTGMSGRRINYLRFLPGPGAGTA